MEVIKIAAKLGSIELQVASVVEELNEDGGCK